jgi:hypothetical protein
MGWIQDQFKRRTDISGKILTETATPNDSAGWSREREAWGGLLHGFGHDVEEFQRLGGNCTLQQLSGLQCRISNAPASITVVVTADLSAHTVEYRYESDQEKTAVPEKGILTLRPSDASVDLYSADQRLTSEQARQLVLEPLLFPTLPTDLASTGT